MTQDEIIQVFRDENPEITNRVIGVPTLRTWCELGDKNVCARTRCIQGNFSFESVEDQANYDLTAEKPKFFDIDEMPGGGVSYDNDRVDFRTIARLDNETPSWRTQSSGTPKYYYRRGKEIYFDRAPDDTLTVKIYCVLISDDFDDGNKMPYNQLLYLEPYHEAIVLWLKAKAKRKVGKRQDFLDAMLEYTDYTEWMRKMIQGGSHGRINFQPQR